MKKIILGVLAAAGLTGSTLANAPCAAFNGFYLGGWLNYMQEKFPVKGTYTRGGVTQNISESFSVNGGGIKLFAGYGATVSQGFYLGGELTLGFDRIVGSKKNKDMDANKKINYGIAGRAGYAFSNVLPYVKFGYEGRPSLKIYDVLTVRRSGFILGGGVDVAVTGNVFIRGEYVHGFGAKKNFSGAATLKGVNVAANINIKPTTDTFLLGAAYRF